MEWIERHLMLIITVVWIAGIFWLRQRFVVGQPIVPDEDTGMDARQGPASEELKPVHPERG
jgi:hypothetical protein